MYTIDEVRWMALEFPVALHGIDQVLLHISHMKRHVPAGYVKRIEIDIVHLLNNDFDYDFIADAHSEIPEIHKELASELLRR